LLTQKLITEKENIFVWAVKWLERLLTRWTFDIPSELQDIVDQFIKDNDPIVWFLDDHNIVPGNQIRISNADMYSEFCWYCKNNWLRNVAKNIFTKNLKLRWFQEFRDTNRRWLLISRK
jgi:phage/plasmid-associated DNA primase